jgi:hypothetical protein
VWDLQLYIYYRHTPSRHRQKKKIISTSCYPICRENSKNLANLKRLVITITYISTAIKTEFNGEMFYTIHFPEFRDIPSATWERENKCNLMNVFLLYVKENV